MDVEAWTKESRVGGLTVDRYHLATSTSKCTCRDNVDGVDQVKMMVDQVKARAQGLGDWVVNDKW